MASLVVGPFGLAMPVSVMLSAQLSAIGQTGGGGVLLHACAFCTSPIKNTAAAAGATSAPTAIARRVLVLGAGRSP